MLTLVLFWVGGFGGGFFLFGWFFLVWLGLVWGEQVVLFVCLFIGVFLEMQEKPILLYVGKLHKNRRSMKYF